LKEQQEALAKQDGASRLIKEEVGKRISQVVSRWTVCR